MSQPTEDLVELMKEFLALHAEAAKVHGKIRDIRYKILTYMGGEKIETNGIEEIRKPDDLMERFS